MSGFGNKAKRLRNAHGMSLRMLAERMEISAGQLSKYENDIHEPTLNTLKKYKEIFGVTLDYLCDDEED